MLRSTLLLFFCVSVSAQPLDDFEDGDRRDWIDYAPGLGGAVTEAFGQLTLEVPATLAQAPALVAAAKESQRLALAPGPALELRVDVVGPAQEGVFAVLAWLPEAEPLAQAVGYHLAWDGRKARVGKALHQYFLSEATTSPSMSTHVQIVLALTEEAGAVTLRARVLDQAAGGAVLFDRTVLDTELADPLASGTERWAAPFRGPGRFALMAYAEGPNHAAPTQVSFDNAEVTSPAPANHLPVIHSTVPVDSASFVPREQLFKALATYVDPWPTGSSSSSILAPVDVPGSAGSFGRGGDERTVRFNGVHLLRPNTTYAGRWFALHPDGVSNNLAFHFDTFCEGNRVIELEDYDFEGGRFIDLPTIVSEGAGPTTTTYDGQVGWPGVDFQDHSAAPTGTGRRPGDPVMISRSFDLLRPPILAIGEPGQSVFDYDVRGIEAGEFLTFTRTFPPNDYQVWLRVAVLNLDRAEAVLERVAKGSDGQETNQVIGRFVAGRSGFAYRNVPLTDTNGAPAKVRLAGVETLRLRQMTSAPADTDIRENYLVFAPEVDLCATIESAPDLAVPYEQDLQAALHGSTVTVRRQEAGTRFFRLSSSVALRIVNPRATPDGLVFEVEPW